MQVIDLIYEEVKRINEKIDTLMTKESCNRYRNNCNKKDELKIKTIIAISSLFTAAGSLATFIFIK